MDLEAFESQETIFGIQKVRHGDGVLGLSSRPDRRFSKSRDLRLTASPYSHFLSPRSVSSDRHACRAGSLTKNEGMGWALDSVAKLAFWVPVVRSILEGLQLLKTGDGDG